MLYFSFILLLLIGQSTCNYCVCTNAKCPIIGENKLVMGMDMHT